MHIEIDVFEIAVLIICYQVIKWAFRAAVFVVLGKVVVNVKKKGEESLNAVKNSFGTREDKKENK